MIGLASVKLLSVARTDVGRRRQINEDALFRDDARALGLEAVEETPRATDEANLQAMADLIHALEKNGHTYVSDGSIYFKISTLPAYGKLAHLDAEGMKPGARVDSDNYAKEDARDFVLWKATKPDEPTWNVVDPPGRPGWHLECSAMALRLLGESPIDIHAGGIDLIFPHHENEIAQSRSAFGHAIMAKYWMHNGFLNISGEKMSKSLGNFFTVHELLDQFPGEVIRLLLLSAHYRQPLDFTHEGLTQAKATLDRWYGALRGKDARPANAVPQSVEDALSDDLNTPLAISALHQLSDPADLRAGADTLGLLQQEAEAWFRWTPAGSSGPTDVEIETAIAARQAARKARDFKESDRIRDELKARGVILEDGAKGTTWKRG
jgi:cysteinyl-tRNA synthetase